jgi:hypothetical protein
MAAIPMLEMITAFLWALVKRIELARRSWSVCAGCGRYGDKRLTIEVISPFGVSLLAGNVED